MKMSRVASRPRTSGFPRFSASQRASLSAVSVDRCSRAWWVARKTMPGLELGSAPLASEFSRRAMMSFPCTLLPMEKTLARSGWEAPMALISDRVSE